MTVVEDWICGVGILREPEELSVFVHGAEKVKVFGGGSVPDVGPVGVAAAVCGAGAARPGGIERVRTVNDGLGRSPSVAFVGDVVGFGSLGRYC